MAPRYRGREPRKVKSQGKTEENNCRLSECLYIVKALAILSVASAHCGNVPAEYSCANRMVSVWLGYCGTAGVPIFYLLAGYFFEQNRRPWRSFWKNKLITVIIPWIFCATILWLYVVLRKGGITVAAWARFVLGDGSPMYFVTVLLVLYAVFFYLKKYAVFLWGITAVSLLGVVSVGWGINIGVGRLANGYLDPLNWAGYFALGILVQKMRKMSGFLKLSKKILPVTVVCYLGVCWGHLSWKVSWTYWSRWALFNIALQILICFGISECLCGRGKMARYLSEAGKVSYTIFLCHQLLVGGLVYVTNKADCFILTLLRPLIVVTVWCGIVWLARRTVLKYLPQCKNVLKLIGLRG